MYPILVTWGDFYLPAWHFFFLLAAWFAYLCMSFLRSHYYEKQLSAVHLNIIFSIGYVAGYFGARGFSIVVEEQPATFLEGLFSLFSLGPLTFYGGALLASLFLLLYSVFYKPAPWRVMLDILAPSSLGALALGRVGCFLNGDDYGKPAHILDNGLAPWWAVTFPNLEDGIARIPIQLIESGVSILGLILALTVFSRIKNRFGPGALGFLCVAYYSIARFFIEFYRDDFRGGEILGMSPSQIVSIILFFLAGLFLSSLFQDPGEI